MCGRHRRNQRPELIKEVGESRLCSTWSQNSAIGTSWTWTCARVLMPKRNYSANTTPTPNTSNENQSIYQNPKRATHKHKRSQHPSTTTWAANPASRSNAGLGGQKRIAQASSVSLRHIYSQHRRNQSLSKNSESVRCSSLSRISAIGISWP